MVPLVPASPFARLRSLTQNPTAVKATIFIAITAGFFAMNRAGLADGDRAERGVERPSIEAIQAAQADFTESLAPHTQFVINGVDPDAETVPLDVATTLPALRDDFESGVDEWMQTSAQWRLGTRAEDGLPARGDLDAYNAALRTWSDLHLAYADLIVSCAGSLSLPDCIGTETDLHTRWQDAQVRLTRTEAAMLYAAAASD